MVVLAASIITRGGKPLVSRQFRDLTKDRVTELLSKFQGLVANSSSQHTFVEDEHVRYVYKPFDDYYIILITNRQSNIIQDLDTLKIFAQSMNTYLNGYDENEIFESAFEIVSAFDEVITMGYKENLSMTQINTYLAMESHEEKIQEIIERNKEFEAAEERKRRAKEISRREHERKLGMPLSAIEAGNRFQASNDPNLSNAYNSYYSNASPAAQQSYYSSQHKTGITEESLAEPVPPVPHAGAIGGRGMSLGGGRRNPIAVASQRQSRVSTAPSPPLFQETEDEKPTNNGILVTVKESISAELTRDGTIASSELKGSLDLRINSQELAHSKILLDPKVDVKDKSYQFKTHPNIDKNLFLSSNVVGLRDQKKAFPFNDQTLAVLRWRKVGAADDNSLIPLEVSTWVSPSDSEEGVFDVTLEFEINANYGQALKDLRFVIPVATEKARINDDTNDVNAEIESADEENGIMVKVGQLDAGISGVVGLIIEAGYEEALFPMSIFFKSSGAEKAISGISVANVKSSREDATSLPFDSQATLKTEEYLLT
ncbi:LAMI_0D01574g1_1 [Lachancea mirantina]|uniref:Coatomer subunit delta n=1 Tax=Lachancea mirantina TaxID=1230905 RepID=A0A1G4J8P5_9SACH|nr:LAMI_0D01574g1_1 [Lachancea mirantina]